MGFSGIQDQERRQKDFQGWGGQRKKRPKNSKKDRKIALLSLFRDGTTEKRPNNSKNTEKQHF